VAVWQFKVALLPQQWIDAGGSVLSLEAEDGYEFAAAWRGYDRRRLQEMLGALLPRGKSWHADLILWGNFESDDIQLSLHNGAVESVQVRFDLRNPNFAMFLKLAALAKELHLAILAPEAGTLLSPEPDRLLRAAAESAAAHFVIDPESFLLAASVVNKRAT
jgi:hypothetical protein